MRTRIALGGAIAAAIFFIGFASVSVAKPDRPGSGKHDLILERLDQIVEDLERIEAKLDGPQTSTTFCISQGRGVELAANLAGGIEGEASLGPGWTSVVYGKATAELDVPLILPVPPFVLPTEAKIEFAGGLGRNLEICIELPLELSPADQDRLEQIAEDINAKTGDSPAERGKFQRRARRLLRYADRRVPGQRTATDIFADIDGNGDSESEFDRADDAGDSLLDVGFERMEEGLDVFRNGKVRELLVALEVPVVHDFINEPDRMFEALPNLQNGEGPLFCNDVGISGRMRQRHPRLDRMCSRLEDLPTFKRVRNASQRLDELSDELVDAIAEILKPVLSNVGESAKNTKTRFCNSRIGKRRIFDRFCGRR